MAFAVVSFLLAEGSWVTGEYERDLQICLGAAFRSADAIGARITDREIGSERATLHGILSPATPLRWELRSKAPYRTFILFVAGSHPAPHHERIAARMKAEFERHLYPGFGVLVEDRAMSMGILLSVFVWSAQDLDRPKEKATQCDLAKIAMEPYCGACDRLEPKRDKDGRCALCKGEIANVRVCVKDYFTCGACNKVLAKDEPHCKGAENRSVTVKARIAFKCPSCGTLYEREGICVKEPCRKSGKSLVKTCRRSGRWPHGGKLETRG